jgi:hypothetical protein
MIRAMRQCGVREVVVVNGTDGVKSDWLPDLMPWMNAVRQVVLSREQLVWMEGKTWYH